MLRQELLETCEGIIAGRRSLGYRPSRRRHTMRSRFSQSSLTNSLIMRPRPRRRRILRSKVLTAPDRAFCSLAGNNTLAPITHSKLVADAARGCCADSQAALSTNPGCKTRSRAAPRPTPTPATPATPPTPATPAATPPTPAATPPATPPTPAATPPTPAATPLTPAATPPATPPTPPAAASEMPLTVMQPIHNIFLMTGIQTTARSLLRNALVNRTFRALWGFERLSSLHRVAWSCRLA